VDYCGPRERRIRQPGDFDDLAQWESGAAAALRQPGPRFLRLAVQPAPEEYLRFATPPIGPQLAALRTALRS
jgi:hypothetical protein